MFRRRIDETEHAKKNQIAPSLLGAHEFELSYQHLSVFLKTTPIALEVQSDFRGSIGTFPHELSSELGKRREHLKLKVFTPEVFTNFK